MDIREEIARIINPRAWRDPIIPETYRECDRDASLERADALMPLVARIQAQALREAADEYTNIDSATKARPHARTWLRARADRLEQGQ